MTPAPPDETILLVEDDPPTRSLISRVLQNQGYQLLEARNGHEALSLATNHRGRIDLLFTDIVMPDMDGFTLGERLGESHPRTQVLFMSGNSDRSIAVRWGLREAGEAFLLKPFTSGDLLCCSPFASSWTAPRTPLTTEGRRSATSRRTNTDPHFR